MRDLMYGRQILWVSLIPPPCLPTPLLLGIPRSPTETQHLWKAAGLRAVHTYYLWYQPAAKGMSAAGSRKAGLPSSEGLGWQEWWMGAKRQEHRGEEKRQKTEDRKGGVLIGVLILLQICTNKPDRIHECFAGTLPVSGNR